MCDCIESERGGVHFNRLKYQININKKKFSSYFTEKNVSSFSKIKCLMLFREMVTAYFENNANPTYTLLVKGRVLILL